MNVSYEPAARAEVADALNWYLTVAGQTIADSFERELDKAVRLLMQFPQLGTPGLRESRKLRLSGFPYILHYRANGDMLRILAVAHQGRKPGYWRGRV